MTGSPWLPFAPEAFACFDRAEALAAGAVEPAVLDPVRVAVAAAVLHPEESARTPVGDPAGDPDPRAVVCVRFAEQFVVDVSGIDDELRGALGVALGADTFVFAQALYVVDVFQRGRIALGRLFDTEYGIGTSEPMTGDLWATLEEFMRIVALGDALDPVTTELVRLRGARAHQCRVCQSRLSLRALDAAGDASVFAADDGGARSERERAALDLTDAARSRNRPRSTPTSPRAARAPDRGRDHRGRARRRPQRRQQDRGGARR